MRNLVAISYSMEFGWMICSWIPHIRSIAPKYKDVIVVGPNEYNYLYRDFAHTFVDYNEKGGRDRWLINGHKGKIPEHMKASFENCEYIIPNKKNMYSRDRKYYKYGKKIDELSYDLVIHARAENDYKSGEERNWNPRKYEKLITDLGLKKVCCIGSIKGAYYIGNTHDYRGVSMSTLCDVLHSSKLCIGTSSGPMHLASYCGCKHIVFTDKKHKKSIGGTNRDRYKRLWNGLKTECSIIDNEGWKPSYKTVLKVLRAHL